MRKFIATILAFLYITTSGGATLHMHYCMGQLANWGLGHDKSKTCGKCGMKKSDEKENGCCRDEHKFVSNKGDQKTGETGIRILQLLSLALPQAFYIITEIVPSSLSEKNPISHAPPRGDGVAVYIRNCIFLI
ncbi:MAG: hypothetical protein HZB42_04250 [Sphingobacteriales bacterium]|nr:hypothetical protein [Sphingobacteriales bacterium]